MDNQDDKVVLKGSVPEKKVYFTPEEAHALKQRIKAMDDRLIALGVEIKSAMRDNDYK